MERVKITTKLLKQRKKRMLQNPTIAQSLMHDLLFRHFKTHVRRQVILRPYIVDFLLPDKCLVVEIEGKTHDENNPINPKRDRRLEARYRMKVVRISADDVGRIGKTAQIIQTIKKGIEEAKDFAKERTYRNQKLENQRQERLIKQKAKKIKATETKTIVKDPELEQKKLAFDARQREEQAKAEREKAERLKRLYARTF